MLAFILAVLLVLILTNLWSARSAVPAITDCPSCMVVEPTATLTPVAAGATKRALLLGLNYEGTDNALYGCQEDVENLREMLVNTMGFSDAEIVTLTDDTTPRPTRANILQSLTDLITDTQTANVAFVWFSGHGLLIPDDTAASGMSNAWYPLDGRDQGLILETELYEVLSRAPAGAKVFVGSDCCYSGTLLDLKYMVGEVSLVRKLREAKMAARLAGGATMQLPHSLPRPDYSAMTGPSAPKADTKSPKQAYVLVSDANNNATAADMVCLAGSRDDQTSADFYRDNQAQGAMTWAFLTTLRTFGKTTALSSLLAGMRLLLAKNLLPQIPQLSLGRPYNPAQVALDQLI